ncbi:MAG: HD domain-containing protein, partial [Gemmatimonadetes bacterium]|nr:HD domain-containing protein [Gemmatimonadota bacterium]
MIPETDFLISLGQALSAAALYGDRHPAFRSAADGAFRSLLALLEAFPAPRYSFLESEVIFANRRLRELREWHWSQMLADAGAQRIEVAQGIDREEFDRLLASLVELLDPTSSPAEGSARIDLPHARVGTLAVGERERLRKLEDEAEEPAAGPELEEETQAIDHLLDQAENRGLISLAVARAVVQSLSIVLQYGRPLLELLIPVRRNDEYTTVHSLNVSVLSMSLAEAVGVPREDVKDIGEAALLHDVGKAYTPAEVLQKPGKLTPEEWEIIKRHPEDGARIILRSGGQTEFAAVVAYEHHLTWQGGGYPKLRYPRRPHPVSQLVQICDVFDALRTERPFRGPWPVEKIFRYLSELSGTDLNPEVLAGFQDMLVKQGVQPGEDAEEAAPIANAQAAPSANA